MNFTLSFIMHNSYILELFHKSFCHKQTNKEYSFLHEARDDEVPPVQRAFYCKMASHYGIVFTLQALQVQDCLKKQSNIEIIDQSTKNSYIETKVAKKFHN